MKKEKARQTHRLFIKVIDRTRKPIITDDGKQIIYVKWVEVAEADFGSWKCPNKDILEFKLVPIEYEDDGKEKQIDFKRLFGDFFD